MISTWWKRISRARFRKTSFKFQRFYSLFHARVSISTDQWPKKTPFKPMTKHICKNKVNTLYSFSTFTLLNFQYSVHPHLKWLKSFLFMCGLFRYFKVFINVTNVKKMEKKEIKLKNCTVLLNLRMICMKYDARVILKSLTQRMKRCTQSYDWDWHLKYTLFSHINRLFFLKCRKKTAPKHCSWLMIFVQISFSFSLSLCSSV